ncbi:MAG: tetratricopeptide repeat protein, partial [Proteobacteria bacterium]|nr:tetratricopeptide repeat protein [Pseudomonadota bacterium]
MKYLWDADVNDLLDTQDDSDVNDNSAESQDTSPEAVVAALEIDRAIPADLIDAFEAALQEGSADPEQGIKTWQELFEKAPGHPIILDELESLYAQTEKWAAFADFLKRNARSTENMPAFIATNMRLAKVYDEYLKQDVMTVNTYQSIIRAQGDYLPVLEAAAQKYESMERWPDLVKVLKAHGELLTDPVERVEIWLRVAQLFLQRFSNQAEAIKAFEQVLEADPHHEQAIEFLKEMYEKRRDWEKLVDVMQRQASLIDNPDERIAAVLEIARLASDKVKKPPTCIPLWEDVLQLDAENAEAMAELVQFYERGKEWEKLAVLLEKQLEQTMDAAEQTAIWQKLGNVYGDRIGDDDRAIVAWKALVELNPDDRRAQDQLRRRYIATQAWDELEAFYAVSEKWDELIRVLEREAEKEDLATEARISMYFKVAELYRDKRERPDRATAAYETALTVDPNNLEVAELLIPIYEEAGDEPAKLSTALEVRLAHESDDDARLALILRIGRIAENDLSDFARAFENYFNAFSMHPADGDIQDNVERVAGQAGRWEDVAEAYRNLSENADDATQQVDFRLRMARVLSDELNRPEEALKHHEEILAVDPQNAKAVFALERIFAQMGRFEELMDIYAKRIELAADDDERKEIFYNQAMLWEEEIDDPSKAIAVYEQIVDMAGDELRALRAMDRLYLRGENWPQLASVLQRELALGAESSEEEGDLRYRLGQVLEVHMNEAPKALEAYRDVLALLPEHSGATAALEGLLDNADCAPQAAEILSPIYEEASEWEKLVRVDEILVQASSDALDKYELLMKIGAVCGQNLSDSARAFQAYSQAFSLAPDRVDALEQLEAIAAIEDTWEQFVSVLEPGAAAAQDPVHARELWMKAARIYDAQLDNTEAAVRAYRAALHIDQRDAEAIAALEQIYSREEKWADLIDVLRIKVDVSSDATEKAQVYRQMAMIFKDMLEKHDEAIASMKELLLLDPADLDALQSLDRLFTHTEKWADLADNLQQQLSLEADVSNIISLKLRLAGLQEAYLSETSAAIDVYREVLDLDLENDAAISALEAMLDNAEVQQDVAEILEPIYRSLGQWEKLVAVYEIMIQLADDAGRRVELLHEISELYESAGDEPEKAFQALSKALRTDPTSERTRDDLERLARVLNLLKELVALYEEVVAGLDAADLAVLYHMSIAAICESQLQDTPCAIRHYREVLGIDPMNLDAATSLETAYQLEENYEDLAAIYLKKVEIIPDLEEQKDLLFKASQIYEELLENTGRAVEVYLRILEIDEDDLRAIAQLEGIYLRQERWEELQEIYNRKVDLLDSPDDKKDVLYVLGAMYERELNDVRKAITTYQRILEFDPDDFQAVQRLDILFTEAEEWPDLLSILEREIQLVHDPDEAISFKYRIAELYVRHLDDVPRSVEYLRDILSISPDHAPSLALLEELLQGEREPLLAAEVLEPLYQDLAEWRKLIALLEVRLRNADDAWQQVELLHQAAGVLESELHLDAPGEAFDAYARALPLDLENEKTLMSLDDLAERLNRFEDYARLIDAQLTDLDDEQVAIALGLRVAAIYEERLDKGEDAIARFVTVLSLDPENAEAIHHLDKLYQLSEKWDALADILQKEALLAQDPEESLDVQFRLGQLYQHELENLERAVEVYREILATEPEHERSISALEMLFSQGEHRAAITEILEPLLRMQGEWGKLVGLYEKQLEDIADVDERLALQHRIAETLEEKLFDPVEAFNWYCRAFSESPLDEKTGEDIERLAAAIDGWNDLFTVYQQVFAQCEDVDTKKIVAKRMARAAEEELHDVARAEQALRASLELDAADLEVLHDLDRIYTQYMEWERLVGILELRAKTEPADADRVDSIFRMGDVLATQLDETEKARVAYHRIVDELQPDHLESLERLEVIYADREDWANLYAVYEKMTPVLSSDGDLGELSAKMATLASECLDDIESATHLWHRVLELLGEESRALEALGQLYARTQNWSELVEVLERAVGICDDDTARIRIYSQLGTVWGEHLERDRNALDNWQNVLSIDIENIPALKAIANIYESNKDWEDLIDTLERLIEVGASQFELEELKAYYAKLGRILSDVMERPFDAINVWERASSVDPSDMQPLMALEQLYAQEESWEEFVLTLGRKAELLESDEQIETWLRQAATLEDELAQPLRSKDSYLNILRVAPLHEHAFERASAIMNEEESWEELIQLYSERLTHVEDVSEHVRLIHLAADIYETRLMQEEDAFNAMYQAFSVDYTNEATLTHLERLTAATHKWDELIGAANMLLTQAMNDANIRTQIDLSLIIGKWYVTVGNPVLAIQYFQNIISLDVHNAAAYRAMGAVYRDAQQWPELVTVLKHAAEHDDNPETRKLALADLGEVYLDYLDDIPEARRVYKEALSIDSGMESALRALEKIFRASEDWNELIPILRHKVEGIDESDVDSIIATRLRIAEIYEENLNDSGAAVSEYRQNLALDSSHAPSLKGLERLYLKKEAWPELYEVLETQLEYAASERERVELLSRTAAMLETEFVKPEQAIEKLEMAADIDPANTQVLESLERLYQRERNWEALVATLEKHVDALLDVDERIPLYEQIAQVYAAQLQDVDRAMDALKAILDIDPDNEKALDELAKLQEKIEDWVSAHDTLRRLADSVTDPDLKVDLYYRLGNLNETQLMDRYTAVEHFRSALDILPSHVSSLAALRVIHEEEGEWLAAAKALDALQGYTESARHRSKFQYDLGVLYRDKLSEPETAVHWFEEALKSDADNQDAAEPLVDVYIENKQWEDASRLLDMLVRLGGKRDAKEMLPLREKAGLVADKLGNLEKAIVHYQSAYDADTTQLSTLLSLADALYRNGDWDKAFKLYQMVLVNHRDTQDREQIVEIFYRLGDIKAQVKEDRKALNMFDKALEQD